MSSTYELNTEYLPTVLIPNGAFVVGALLTFVVATALWAIPAWIIGHRPEAEVRSTGLPRAIWIVLIVALGPIAAVGYTFVLHLRVRATA